MSKTKQNVSVRLSESDIKKIKGISERLGVKDSELFRYIIKDSLARLLPFQQGGINGVDLIPALLTNGKDLTQHLDIDTERLNVIVNEGVVSEDKLVQKEDLDLLTLMGKEICHDYLTLKLAERGGGKIKDKNLEESLKEYLYRKYCSEEVNQSLRTQSINVYQ